MQTITTIGLDIAKSVFQVHGTDAAGQVVSRAFDGAAALELREPDVPRADAGRTHLR